MTEKQILNTISIPNFVKNKALKLPYSASREGRPTMKILPLVVFFCVLSVGGTAQSAVPFTPKSRKGEFYFYWGWNRAHYTNSNIRFTGDTYDFELADVVAKDHQSHFEGKLYFNPATATIPQYNFRLGYFINDHYNISFGIDHMKYVVRQNQTVNISGNIENSSTQYDGQYRREPIQLKEGFLKFEHTDGLNYINFDLRRFDALLTRKHFDINITEGFGAGFLYPRTNTTLLGGGRYDEFHVSGFGMSAAVGVNIEFYNHFFIQSELKGGYINMPDIRTTMDARDSASQQFFFCQYNLVFGANFRFGKYRLNLKQEH